MSKTLICSAWAKETEKLHRNLRSDFEIANLGIGYLDAALALERILQENKKIEKIIFIGTCGAYSKTLELKSLVEVDKSALLNFGTIEQKAYVVKAYDEYHCYLNFNKKLKKVYCLSSLEITKDTKISKKIVEGLDTRDCVENMELYGIVKVAQEHGKKISALLGITNYTNIDANQDWKENHELVSEKLCNELLTVSKISSS